MNKIRGRKQKEKSANQRKNERKLKLTQCKENQVEKFENKYVKVHRKSSHYLQKISTRPLTDITTSKSPFDPTILMLS